MLFLLLNRNDSSFLRKPMDRTPDFPKIIFKTQTKAMNGLLFLTCLESFLEARAAHSVSS